jgi:hypothetical protein
LVDVSTKWLIIYYVPLGPSMASGLYIARLAAV